jgi:hypothetical protein
MFDLDQIGSGSQRMPFNYSLPAEIFMETRKRGGRPVGYRRFRTTAEAIRFVVEELTGYPALQTWMNVGDERFDGNAIRRLYDSSEYPLPRRT